VYDPQADSWTTLSPMPKAAAQHTSAAVFGGKLYVIGGDVYYNGSGLPPSSPIDNVQIYDPSTDKWSSGKPMPTARSGAGVETLNGVVFTVSGQTATSVVPLVEVYDPIADAWCTGVPIPTVHGGAHCNAIGASLYCVGGSATNGYLPTLDVFTPTAP
jgi:N-acetylneuraminic acid mutarotase